MIDSQNFKTSDINVYNNNIQKEPEIKMSKENKEKENYYHSINKSKFEFVKPGEVLGIIGEVGSGKSSLLQEY